MEPTDKDEAIDNFLSQCFGVNRKETIQANKCVRCGLDAVQFDDELSQKEYVISGLCMACQRIIFTPPESCDGEALYFDESGNACDGFCDSCPIFDPKDF